MVCTKFLKCFDSIIIIFLILLNYSCNSSGNQPDINHPAHADSILDYTNDLLNSGRIKQSEIYLDSAYKEFSQPGPIDLWKKYSHKNNFYLNYEFDLDKAKLYADSMFTIVKDKKDIYEKEYAWAIFANGDVLVAEKKYAEAFKRYYEGREFVKKNLNNCNTCQFTNKLGLVRFRQSQYLKAVPYLKQALIENSQCKASANFDDVIGFPQNVLNTIALCFEKSNMPDSAIKYYKSALTLLDRHKKHFPVQRIVIETARGVIYGNLGGTYATINNYNEAEKYLKESIQISEGYGYEIQDAQTAKIKLADLYLKFSHLEAANNLLNQVQAHLALPGKNPANENIRLNWYRLKWIYAGKRNDIPNAYNYIQKYHIIQDSIYAVNSLLKNVDMDIAFRENEQQHKLTLLNKDSEMKTAYLIAAVIFSLLVVCILIAVLQNRGRLKILNEKVNVQNSDLNTTLSALEQSQEENTRIMKIVAHDLRSPMAATISIATMLLENGNLPPEDTEMLELMKTSSLHSIEMIADLLNMNTTAEGLRKEPVEMHTLLRYCVNLLKFRASEKKQNITLNTPNIILNLNREKIWRVISNLIVNAIKFSPVESDINIQLQQEEHSILISIKDHGIGIPESLRDKIFNMFTDAKRPGTLGEHSFGLGLAISRQIVEAHGGKIWFEHNVDSGTTFYVELPLSN